MKSSEGGTVPLHLMPVIEEPIHTMAFDIVGPFPRSKEVKGGVPFFFCYSCLPS